MRHGPIRLLTSLLLTLLLAPSADTLANPDNLRFETPTVSSGAEASRLRKQLLREGKLELPDKLPTPETQDSRKVLPGPGFEALDYDEDILLTGIPWIPPDPICAVGFDRMINANNSAVQMWAKMGGGVSLAPSKGLKDFFAGGLTAPPRLGDEPFDPKIVWDTYEERFVIMALERFNTADGEPVDGSSLLVAVSRTSFPSSFEPSEWHFLHIDSKLTLGVTPGWADFPGLEVDEEAVYMTVNYFTFGATFSFIGSRLWIIDKDPGSGFYAGGPASTAVYNPYVGGIETVHQPAQVFAPAGAGPGIGTYLMGYSGITDGTDEYVQVVRVDDPLATSGGPFFTIDLLSVGDLEVSPDLIPLPEAPQPGGPELIATNSRQALDCVWRDDKLYLTATIDPAPAYDPINSGQATAHVFRVDTSAITSAADGAGLVTFDTQASIGGEAIAPMTHTYYPAVAVNALGQVKIGYSASAPTLFAGAYVSEVETPGFTEGTFGVVHLGEDYYFRAFGGTRNRWGDYSGIALDPLDERFFWVFNQYAGPRGTPALGEDGRWETAWRRCASECVEVVCPPDTTALMGSTVELDFSVVNCSPQGGMFTIKLEDTLGWCASPGEFTTGIAPDGSFVLPITCLLPPSCDPPLTNTITLTASSGPDTVVCTTEVTTACGPELTVTPQQIVIAEAAAGDTTCATVCVINTGDLPLLAAPAGCDSSGFFLDTTGFTPSIAAGDTSKFDVCIDPVALGPDSCQVIITSDGGIDTVDVTVLVVTAAPGAAPMGTVFAESVRPTPFESSTQVRFRLGAPQRTAVYVFDARGRRVRTVLPPQVLPAGDHVARWDGRDAQGRAVARGVYFVRVIGGEESRVLRAVRLK